MIQHDSQLAQRRGDALSADFGAHYSTAVDLGVQKVSAIRHKQCHLTNKRIAVSAEQRPISCFGVAA